MDLRTATKSFGSRVAEYQSGRPDYPAALLAELPSAATILELGAGTGKFTRLLQRLERPLIVVEPVTEMARQIPRGGKVFLVRARAEAIPLADASVDLICAATAFHWFDYEPATAEICRLLRPGGSLALIWNVRDNRVPWVAAVSALLDANAGETHRFASGRWRRILDDRRFALRQRGTHAFSYPMPPSGIVDRVMSTSFVAALPEPERQAMGDRVRAIVAGFPELAGTARIEFPYISELYLLRRVG